MGGRPDLSVKVLNISPKVTVEELCTFFSFCGTVDDDINLQRVDEGDNDQPYSATLTFKQPYAFQTALLLDDAVLVDRRVRISAVENQSGVPITSSQCPEKKNKNSQAVVNKGHEVLINYARYYKVRESGRQLVQQTRTTAEHAAGRVGTAIVQSSCFSKSAIWLAGVLDRASKYAAELGNLQKVKDESCTNSRKKK